MSLPAPREAGRYRIGLVCLGNICRSPMAHVVLDAKVAAAGLADVVTVASSGTGGWHVGNPMDPRAAATLAAAGYDGSDHRARQLAATWRDDHDLLLAMDAANLADIGGGPGDPGGTGGPGGTDRVRLFRSFDPEDRGADVPDPYYGGDRGFQEVLAMVERCGDAIVSDLVTSLGR
ncbi:low molecular weight protein-tyrosine-phosphatase [Nocardioides sp. 1609]|uniref:low molecular weight protein-tyrosine-phosphatase n=1 Tax=Nocardioides sp. 1609 TaxID=2508327 RepID=UPI00106F64DC|nr:low molecular weight protein-tyrosine-phosphatase [Nocardioides sp. 1609]